MPRKPTPKEFNEFLAFLHIFLPYIEGVLRALERLKIIPTSLDHSTIWERVRNMNIKFPEANDQLEADGNKHKQGRTIHYSKMG